MKRAFPTNGWWATVMLALAASWLALQAHLWLAAFRVYEQRLVPVGWSVPSSARSQVFTDNDPYYWLSYAHAMVEQGLWRVRSTDIDNVPDGRPVHWSQSVAWLMVLAGFVVRVFNDSPWDPALEQGALWMNPFLHLLLAGTGLVLLVRRAGWLPALAWFWGILAAGDLAWNFHALRPDHQSLHILFSTLSALLLALGGLGWTRAVPMPATGRLWRTLEPPAPSVARRYFIASGVLGGLGLWTGATVQLLTLGAALAAGVYLVLNRPRDGELAFDVRHWRTWARAGALTSLVFYLVEYAGAWPGVRLEVNSPLHALSWWCAGEALAQLERVRGADAARQRRWWPLALWTSGAMLLPLALAWGPATWHALKDPAMFRLHGYIQEFSSYPRYSQGHAVQKFALAYGFWPLLALAAVWLSGKRWSRTYEWGLLWFGFALAVSTGILTWQQVRWLPFFATALLLLLTVILALAGRHAASGQRASRLAGLLWAAAMLQSGVFMYRQWAELATLPGHPDRVVQELAKPVLMKHLALQLAASDPGGSMRLLCEPDLAAPLYYFGGIRTVTSFYWENTEGLRDATDFFADDPRGDKARAIALRRGLTHVMLPAGDELAHIFQFVRDGRFDAVAARRTLLGRACEGKPPAWWLLDRERTVAGHARYRFGKGFVNRTMTVYALAPMTADRTEGRGAP